MSLSKIPSEIKDLTSDYVAYRLVDVVAAATSAWIELEPNRWLAVQQDKDNIWTEFGLYEFLISNEDGSDAWVICVFRGEGPSGSLREMRHTYFNPDGDDSKGYVFYLPINATITALTYLKKYFD